MPMAYVWNRDDSEEFRGLTGDFDFGRSLRPLWVERFYPRSVEEVPEGYSWLPGRGYMSDRDIVRAYKIVRNKNEGYSAPKEEWFLRQQELSWATSVVRLSKACRWSKNLGAYIVNPEGLHGFLDFPWLLNPHAAGLTHSGTDWLESVGNHCLWGAMNADSIPLVKSLAEEVRRSVQLKAHAPTMMSLSFLFSQLTVQLPDSLRGLDENHPSRILFAEQQEA